jgi:peptidoglycan/LPS O-acetylase OafA/YrhL
LSTYLDVVRFGAAVSVLLHHVWPTVFPRHPLPWPGHDAVVVFFVLSGLVIAHAADQPGRTFSIYVQHRVARIASVTVPALLLCAVAAAIIPAGANLYAAPSPAGPWDLFSRLAANLVFMAQSWGLDLAPPYNAPYWSLNYEVWYYVVFGVWAYVVPRWRWLAVAIAALVAGPKIILLMPVWLLGVALYRCRIRLQRPAAVALFGATVAAAGIFFWTDASIAIRNVMTGWAPAFIAPLGGSNQFVGDMLLGLIVAANFLAVENLARDAAVPARLKRSVRFVSSFTFSAYLYHMPLFALIWAGLGLRSAAVVLPLLVTGIVVLGQFTERQLPFYRRALDGRRVWRWVDSRAMFKRPALT